MTKYRITIYSIWRTVEALNDLPRDYERCYRLGRIFCYEDPAAEGVSWHVDNDTPSCIYDNYDDAMAAYNDPSALRNIYYQHRVISSMKPISIVKRNGNGYLAILGYAELCKVEIDDEGYEVSFEPILSKIGDFENYIKTAEM